MRKLLVLILLVSTASYSASLKGITETGDEVLLKDDGTWSYLNPSEVEPEITELNSKKFTKLLKNSFAVKSKKNKSEVWIDAKRWSFEKSQSGATEYEFELKGEDVYAMMINESIEMELESLANVAFENAREAAPDTKIIHKEYRYVNGKKMIFLQMNGTMSGMKFSYLGYYYSNSSGITQLIAYTGTALVDKYRSDMEDFLNGLMIRE